MSSVKVGHGAERLVQARIGSQGGARYCWLGDVRSGMVSYGIAVMAWCVRSRVVWWYVEWFGSLGIDGWCTVGYVMVQQGKAWQLRFGQVGMLRNGKAR